MKASRAHGWRTVCGSVLLLLSLTVAAGCSQPAADPPSSGPFPPRPADLDINLIDPCSVVSAEQRKELGVDARDGGMADVGVGAPSKACGWRNFDTGYGYNFQTIPTGADRALTVPGSTLQSVNGFGSVQNFPEEGSGPGIPPTCQLTIDVNDGQAVRIQVESSDTSDTGSPQALADSCSRAQAFARDVMTTLVNQQQR